MRIYTKTGDRGETGMIGGARVSKNNPRVAAIGSLDELNALLGVLRSMKPTPKIEAALEQIQNDLFVIGASLADPEKKSPHAPSFNANRIHELEKQIDAWEDALPPLKNFILPGGTPLASHLHLSRAVCRRAERDLVAQNESSPLLPEILQYMNRLSDWFFTLARLENFRNKAEETLWRGPDS